MSGCKNIKKDVLAICILIPILVGGLSSLLSGSGTGFYESIKTPSFAPLGIVFPIVWTILYVLMGISCYLVYENGFEKNKSALIVYGVQLALNFAWSIIFFKYRAFLFALIWLIVLWITIVNMIVKFSKVNRCAAILQIPYLLWVTFAGILNYAIYTLNPM